MLCTNSSGNPIKQCMRTICFIFVEDILQEVFWKNLVSVSLILKFQSYFLCNVTQNNVVLTLINHCVSNKGMSSRSLNSFIFNINKAQDEVDACLGYFTLFLLEFFSAMSNTCSSTRNSKSCQNFNFSIKIEMIPRPFDS